MSWDLNLLFWLCVSLAIGILFTCVTFSVSPLDLAPSFLDFDDTTAREITEQISGKVENM